MSTTAALLSWLVLSPLGYLIDRRMPPDVMAYFESYWEAFAEYCSRPAA